MPRFPDLPAALFATLVLAPAALAGATLPERFEQKLAKPFVENAAWARTYDEALQRAREEGKLVFAYFTRSYEP